MSGDTSFAGNNPLAVEFNRVDLNNSDWIYIHNSSINHNISRLLKDGLGKTYLGSWTSLRRSISRWILANTWSRGQAFSIPMSWQWFANSFIFCRALMTITSMQFDITENNLWRNISYIVTYEKKCMIHCVSQCACAHQPWMISQRLSPSINPAAPPTSDSTSA